MFFYYASTAFSMWMLVDAIQRPANRLWIWVILIPFGEVAYFIAVKSHDYRWRRDLAHFRFRSPPSLEDLLYEAEHNPSQENLVGVSAALFDQKEYEEAKRILEQILSRDGSFKRALYGLARCHMLLGEFREAIPHLSKLLEEERGYEDWGVWLDLAKCHRGSDDLQKAVETLTTLMKVCPRIDHAVELARSLHENGQSEDAKHQLEVALRDHKHAPAHVRSRGRGRAREGKKLLKTL